MRDNNLTAHICTWRTLVLPLVLLLFVGCGGHVTIPLPVPSLEVNVDENLPGHIIAASKRITAEGNVMLAAGTFIINDVPIKIADGTTVSISGVQIDLEPIGSEKVRINPSDFVIAFSKPVSLANVAVKELKRDSNPVKIKFDLYESFRNLIAIAIANAVALPTQPSENIVSKVTIGSAKVEMRPDAKIQLAGLDMHLSASSSSEATTVQFNKTTAVFAGKKGIRHGDGIIDLRLLCNINGGNDNKVTIDASAIEVSGVASWSVKDNSFSAITPQPLLIAAKGMSVANEPISLKLTPSDGNQRFRFVAEGNWAAGSYKANLQIKDAFVTASAIMADGQLNFTGISEGLSAVCRDGEIYSVRSDRPIDSVDVTYSKKLDGNRSLSIKSRLPKIDINLKQTSNALGIVFAELVAEATQISLVEKDFDVVTMKCGNTRLSSNESNISGKIDSIAIRLSNGAYAEFADAVIENLSDLGTGSVACILQKSALPESLREELGDASLTVNKVVVKLEKWKPAKIMLQDFKASTSLTVVEQKAREAIEKKHVVKNEDKYVSIAPVDVKLASFKLSPAKDAIHVHIEGTASVSGTIKIQSDDLSSDLVNAVKESLAKKEEELRKAIEEAPKKIEKAVEEAPKKIEKAVQEAPKKIEKAVQEAPKKIEKAVEEAPKKIEGAVKKILGAFLLPRSFLFAVVFADVTLLQTDGSITLGFELDCDFKLIAGGNSSLQDMTVRVQPDNVRVKLPSSYSDIIRKTLFEALKKAGGLEKLCAEAIGAAREFQPLATNEKLGKVHVQEVTVEAVGDKLVVSGTVSMALE